MDRCIGICRNGTRCTKQARPGSTRCGTHLNILNRYGIENTMRDELGFVQIRQRRILREENVDPEQRELLLRELHEVHNREWDEMERMIAARNPDGELAKFARDAQNVHTTRIVDMTKHVISTVLNIDRPSGFKNQNPSKSIFAHIIMSCPFTERAILQFSQKYWQREDIYDMGSGIYNRVADAVWYYITQSPHKEDLVKIFASEIDSSVGMCAQGNLSRLCNVLSGYLDGVGDQRSIAEILGDEFAVISREEDVYRRIALAVGILTQHKIPKQEWITWIQPLAEDELSHADIMVQIAAS